MIYGRMNVAQTGIFRLSSCLRRAREQGQTEVVAAVTSVYQANNTCPTHGFLEDPIIGTVPPNQIAICCPWCSAPEVLAAWEAEGKTVLA